MVKSLIYDYGESATVSGCRCNLFEVCDDLVAYDYRVMPVPPGSHLQEIRTVVGNLCCDPVHFYTIDGIRYRIECERFGAGLHDEYFTDDELLQIQEEWSNQDGIPEADFRHLETLIAERALTGKAVPA